MKEGWFEGTDGTKLYYSVEGEGVPVLLVDGIGCAGYVWNYLVPYLKDRCMFINCHYKGHGRSDMPLTLKNVSIEDLAKDLGKLCDELKIAKVLPIGHSMGVQVILEFAHLFPEKTLGLVPVCGSYGKPLDTFHDNKLLKTVFPTVHNLVSAKPHLVQPLWTAITNSELAYQIATKFEVNGKLIKREDFKPYFDHISKVDVNLFVEMLSKAQQHNSRDYLGDIEAPTLIVGGEFDTFTPMWLSKEMQQLMPNAELIMIPGGSHTAPIEMPDLVNLRIEKFVRDKIEPLMAKKKATKKKTTTKKTTTKAKTSTKKTAAKKTAKKDSPNKKTSAKKSEKKVIKEKAKPSKEAEKAKEMFKAELSKKVISDSASDKAAGSESKVEE